MQLPNDWASAVPPMIDFAKIISTIKQYKLQLPSIHHSSFISPPTALSGLDFVFSKIFASIFNKQIGIYYPIQASPMAHYVTLSACLPT